MLHSQKSQQGVKGRARLVWVALAVAGIPMIAVILLWWNDPMDAGYSGADRIALANPRSPARGPLRVEPGERRYFTDNGSRTVYLTGSHTWTNFQDICDHSLETFDYPNYLRLLREKNHNFMRLWVWEQAAWAPWTTEMVKFQPLPYLRTGSGTALDGEPKFDVAQWNQEYFDRLRSRVIAARDNGIYVSVMLFQGWSVGKKPNEPMNPWGGHPFHRDNNVNEIDGDLNGDGEGKEVHTLENPAVTALQEAYVRKVVDTVNDLDNVLWEICNEGNPDSIKWQYHMIEYVKRYEAGKETQHPVGMTAIYPDGHNTELFDSPADWVSPNSAVDDYRNDPPAADGSKVVMIDTDHLWGVGGDRGWVWKSFTRGLNPIYMDPFEQEQWRSSGAKFESCRRAMGDTLAYANRMNLAKTVSHNDLVSSGYCLADPGEEYLVYIPFRAPEGGKVHLSFVLRNPIRNLLWQFKRGITVNLSAATVEFVVEWFDPTSGRRVRGQRIKGGKTHNFTAPFGGDAVLYLKRSSEPAPEGRKNA